MWPRIAVTIVLCAAAQVEGNAVRIVNGDDTVIQEHPFQLALFVNKTFICGASILSPTVAVTAAYCISEGSSSEQYWVRAGSTIRGSGGQIKRVAKATRHPKYDPRTNDYDIAVLKLETRLAFGRAIQPIGLPVAGSNVEGQTGIVTGWGNTIGFPLTNLRPASNSQLLKQLVVRVVPAELCSFNTTRQLCASPLPSEVLASTCSGDTGGPLEIDGTLQGVVAYSPSLDCGTALPDAFTRVADADILGFLSGQLRK